MSNITKIYKRMHKAEDLEKAYNFVKKMSAAKLTKEMLICYLACLDRASYNDIDFYRKHSIVLIYGMRSHDCEEYIEMIHKKRLEIKINTMNHARKWKKHHEFMGRSHDDD